MSDPIAKAERSKAKDIRQGLIEQKESVVSSKPKVSNKAVWRLYIVSESGSYLYAKGRTEDDVYRSLEKYKRVNERFRDRTAKFYVSGPNGETKPQSVFNYVLER